MLIKSQLEFNDNIEAFVNNTQAFYQTILLKKGKERYLLQEVMSD